MRVNPLSCPPCRSSGSSWALDQISSLRVRAVMVRPLLPAPCPLSFSMPSQACLLQLPPLRNSPARLLQAQPGHRPLAVTPARRPLCQWDKATAASLQPCPAPAVTPGHHHRCQPRAAALLPRSHQGITTDASRAPRGCQHGAVPKAPRGPGPGGLAALQATGG